MEADPVTTSVRRRQRAMFIASALNAPFALLDLLLPNGPWVALAGGAWTACILVGAALQSARAPAVRSFGVWLPTLSGVAAIAAKSWLTGGSSSVFFPLFLALPLILLAVAPELPGLVAGSGTAALAAGAAVRLAEGRAGADVVYSVVVGVSVLALAVAGAVLLRRQVERERGVERARAEALQALAESERRRAEMERYAEVGRLAATVSHEMNSPLASVTANLRWLEGPDASDAAEQRAVMRETREGVDRLAAVLRRIRQVSLAADADEAASSRSGGAGPATGRPS